MDKVKVAAQLRAKAASTTFPAEAENARRLADKLDPPRKPEARTATGSRPVDTGIFWQDKVRTSSVDVRKVRKWPKAGPDLQSAFEQGMQDFYARSIFVDVPDVDEWLENWKKNGGKVRGFD